VTCALIEEHHAYFFDSNRINDSNVKCRQKLVEISPSTLSVNYVMLADVSEGASMQAFVFPLLLPPTCQLWYNALNEFAGSIHLRIKCYMVRRQLRMFA